MIEVFNNRYRLTHWLAQHLSFYPSSYFRLEKNTKQFSHGMINISGFLHYITIVFTLIMYTYVHLYKDSLPCLGHCPSLTQRAIMFMVFYFLKYPPFHKPRSSVLVNWILVRFYEGESSSLTIQSILEDNKI